MGRRRGGVDRRLAELRVGAPLERRRDPRRELGPQLVEGVELGGICGELVVELGQSLLTHLLHDHVEPRILAGHLGLAVVVGKGELDGQLVAGRGAGQRLLHLCQQALGADLDHVVARGRAFEWLAVRRPFEVDHHQVAACGGPVDGADAREALAEAVELGGDGVGGHLDLGATDLEAAVGAELRPRPDPDLDRELEGLAGGRQIRHVEARVADRRDPRLEQRPLIPLGQRVAERLLEHRLAPHPLHHQGRRHLAAAEPGNPHLAAELACRALDPLLDGVGIDADVEADAAVGELGDRGAHGERER